MTSTPQVPEPQTRHLTGCHLLAFPQLGHVAWPIPAFTCNPALVDMVFSIPLRVVRIGAKSAGHQILKPETPNPLSLQP